MMRRLKLHKYHINEVIKKTILKVNTWH